MATLTGSAWQEWGRSKRYKLDFQKQTLEFGIMVNILQIYKTIFNF